MANQNSAGETWLTIEDTAKHFSVSVRRVYAWLQATEATSKIRRKVDPDTGKKMVHIPTATKFVANNPGRGRPRKNP